MVYFRENPSYKWMMAAGIPIFGNLHLLLNLLGKNNLSEDVDGRLCIARCAGQTVIVKNRVIQNKYNEPESQCSGHSPKVDMYTLVCMSHICLIPVVPHKAVAEVSK